MVTEIYAISTYLKQKQKLRAPLKTEELRAWTFCYSSNHLPSKPQ